MTESFKAKVTRDADTGTRKTPDSTVSPDPMAAHPAEAAKAADPFEPASLRLDQSFANSSVKKLLLTVPIKKPSSQSFVRVHPKPEFRETFALINLKEEREFYLLTPALARELPGEFHAYTIYTGITRLEKVFLWPVRLPDADGRHNEWHRTEAEAALLAQTRWIRVIPNMELRANEVSVAEGVMDEPNWPDHTFRELLRVAFRDRLVDTPDHLVIKKLRGLA
jgi:hypothetical protein